MGWSAPSELFRSVLFAALFFAGAFASLGENVAPEVVQFFDSRSARSGGSFQEIDLQPHFRDPDVTGPVVRMDFRIGTAVKPVYFALFDEATPITVANFLGYVNGGDYENNLVHRSARNQNQQPFVIQGGGFQWTQTQLVEVQTAPPIQNEPGISNRRGTVAMARVGGQPNSATSQWFINLNDDNVFLDGVDGGFTVFARVLGNGMAVADEVAALPRVNGGGVFAELPVKDFPGGQITRIHTVETTATLASALSFSASSNNPALLEASVTGSTLRLTPGSGSGTATVTVSATDRDGITVQTFLSVNVFPKSRGWHVENGASGGPETFVLDPSDSTDLAEDPVPVSFGAIGFGDSIEREFTLRNDGAAAMSDFNFSISGTNANEFAVTSGAGPVTLAPGASTTFRVTFNPAEGGTRTALLNFAGSDPDAPSLQIQLSGEGIDATPPVITPPAPQPPEALIAGPTRVAQVPDYRGSLVVASDNAGVASFTQSPAPGSFATIGEHVLTFEASDAAGNTTTVETVLVVQYDEATLPVVQASGAITGAPVPAEGSEGLPEGSILSAFGTPAISDDRSLAARVTITAGRARLAGIYLENPAGERRLAAFQGQDSGVPNAAFKSFKDPLLSPGGALAFTAKLSGVPAAENEGVWTDLFGPLQAVLRKGTPIPGFEDLKLKSVMSVSFDDSALLVAVKLARVPRTITAANDTALIRITGTFEATVLARTGDDFEGARIKQISVLQPAARSAGQGRWMANEGAVAKLTLSDRRVIIARLRADGSKVTLLRTGTVDPGLGLALATLGLPAIGGEAVAVLATQVRERGIVTGANDAVLLFAPNGTNFTAAAREEPGAGNFAAFSDPVANDQGEMLFCGTKRPAAPRTPATSALWLTNGGTPEIVAQIGASAPGPDGLPLADTAWRSFISFALPDGPGAGPVFIAQVAGRGVNAQSNLGLWALDSGGIVRLLLRAGDDVMLPGGAKRLVSFTLLNSLPGSFGARRSYNSTGAVAVQAKFSDRTQAILRVDIP